MWCVQGCLRDVGVSEEGRKEKKNAVIYDAINVLQINIWHPMQFLSGNELIRFKKAPFLLILRFLEHHINIFHDG